MKTCYHHTSFDTLKKIITNNGLTFRASRYSNYENKEYTWIKDKAYKVVKEICQEQAQPFDNDLMEFNPYIICFCEEGFSKYMWSNYADKNQGIQIEVNSDILLKYSLQNQNPDAFVKCAYLSEKERENNEHIKSAITKIYNTYQVSSNLQDDLLICASCIKQDIYRSEKEYRYMIPHYNQISISRIKNNEVVFSEEYEDEQYIQSLHGKKYYYINFPKEALVSINLGFDANKDRLETIRQHLINNDYNIGNISIKQIEEKLLK